MSHKKSRKHDFGRGAGGGVNLGLIITPMLDMAFQLLAFFIMTYHPPAFVGFIETEASLLPADKKDEPKDKGKGKDKEKQEEQKDQKKQKEEVKGVGDKIKKEKEEKEKKIEKDLAKVEEKDEPPPLESTDWLIVEILTPKKPNNAEPKSALEEFLANGDPISIQTMRPENLGKPKVLNTKFDMPNPAPATAKQKALIKEKYVEELKKELSSQLTAIVKASSKSKLPLPEIILVVDGDLKHRYWMTFYDTCKLAGFNKIKRALRKPEREARGANVPAN